ncbi:MAG: TlpA family protein disulfide reductase [Acidobacteria bacterium]|nr:TlpA family protein disulfide reductase [Acidobacteriota bacterium]MCA1640148.1 TlpA family protein disulfide reductase [Acidobacteriota bacterium]
MKNIKSLLVVLIVIFAFSFSVSSQTVNLMSLDGEKIDVQGQKGKVVILAIGASWLPLSNQQAIFTNKLAKKFAGRDVIIYFVATDSTSPKSKNYASDEDIRKFAATNKMGVPVLRDSDGAITLKKFGIDQLPSFVILGKDGKPAAEAYGGIDPKSDITVSIAQQVDKLL